MSIHTTILVVDDHPDVLFATARTLRKAGYTVFTAETGRQCLEMIRGRRPDLILLDVLLPDMPGTELCRTIKSDPKLKGVYVILVSAVKTESEDQAAGLDDGADGYIVRPIPNRELLARVRAMMRILEAERERDRLIGELKDALAEVKTLSGLLPICSHCNKVRDDKGYWSRIEAYIKEHSDVTFSHGICEECARKHYPDYDLYEEPEE